VAGLLVVAAGVSAWLLTRGSDPASAQTITYTVSRGTVQQTVTATGTLAAAKEADLDFAVSGQVTKVLVKAGDHVHKGQVLARIDDTALRAAYESAKSQLSAARTQYSDDVDASASSTQLAADSASVTSAQAARDQAADDLADAKLRSTITGTVASVDLEVGDQVGSSGGSGGTGGSDSSGSTSGVVVIAPGHYVVDASVSSSDIGKLRKGMQAKVTPTDATGSAQPIFGTVTSVGMVAQSSGQGSGSGSSGAATFPVEITVTGVQKGLYAGTSVNVSITTKQRTNVLTVPALALRTSGGSTYVEKVEGSKTVRTEVTVGDTYDGQTEITSGLKAGDRIELATGLPARINRGGNGGGGGLTNLGGDKGFGSNFSVPDLKGGGGPPVIIQGGP
jgi:macrolide-specific efflux system membrane fusion protein